jgi:polyhydroxyalkanoate synthase
LQAWEDWAFHLMLSSGKQIELCELASEAVLSLCRPPLERDGPSGDRGPNSSDRRFRDPSWKLPPFNFLAQAQLAAEAQWHAATRDIPGMARHHAKRVDLLGSLMLGALSRCLTNPAVLEAAWRMTRHFVAGASLLAGSCSAGARRQLERTGGLQIGENIAHQGTVFRNN